MECFAVLLERQLFFKVRFVALCLNFKTLFFHYIRQLGAALTYFYAFQTDTFRRSPDKELEWR